MSDKNDRASVTVYETSADVAKAIELSAAELKHWAEMIAKVEPEHKDMFDEMHAQAMAEAHKLAVLALRYFDLLCEAKVLAAREAKA